MKYFTQKLATSSKGGIKGIKSCQKQRSMPSKSLTLIAMTVVKGFCPDVVVLLFYVQSKPLSQVMSGRSVTLS